MRKEKLMAMVLLLCPLLATAEMTIRVDHDEFEGTTTIIMWGNELGTSSQGLHHVADIDLDCMKFIASNSEVIYSLHVIYVDEDWLFIADEASLQFLIDGEKFSFDPHSTPSRKVLYGGDVIEQAWYHISAEFLVKIIAAKEVKVRLRGEYPLDRFFTEENFKNFKTFYDEYVAEKVEPDTTSVEEQP